MTELDAVPTKLQCVKISGECLAQIGQYTAGRALEEAKSFFAWVTEAAAKKPSRKPRQKKK